MSTTVPDTEQPARPPESNDSSSASEPTITSVSVTPVARPRERGLWNRLMDRGRTLISDAVTRLILPPAPDGTAPGANSTEATDDAQCEVDDDGREPNARRVGVLHAVTERLRGAADSFVSAKLDEIEARVDAKLDLIEKRIEQKITALNTHLEALRDKELRHRLRLLRLTLWFTVVVALLSLGYKFIDKFWLK